MSCLQRAQVLLELDSPWEAVQAATVATTLAPQWDAAHLTLARSQLNLGEPCLALRTAEVALACTTEPQEVTDEIAHIEQIVQQQHLALLTRAAVVEEGGADGGGTSEDLGRVMQRDALRFAQVTSIDNIGLAEGLSTGSPEGSLSE
jgi:hypothetical protein